MGWKSIGEDTQIMQETNGGDRGCDLGGHLGGWKGLGEGFVVHPPAYYPQAAMSRGVSAARQQITFPARRRPAVTPLLILPRRFVMWILSTSADTGK